MPGKRKKGDSSDEDGFSGESELESRSSDEDEDDDDDEDEEDEEEEEEEESELSQSQASSSEGEAKKPAAAKKGTSGGSNSGGFKSKAAAADGGDEDLEVIDLASVASKDSKDSKDKENSKPPPAPTPSSSSAKKPAAKKAKKATVAASNTSSSGSVSGGETPASKPKAKPKPKPKPEAAAAAASSPSTSVASSSSATKAGAAAASAKPKAAAAPKAKPGDAKGIILEYLQERGRPYGAQNVFENLQKKIGLATIKSVLDALAASGSIKFKEFGKSKVYFPVPEDVDPATLQSELGRLEAGMKEGQALKQSLVAKKSGLEGQVRGLGEAMDDATLTKALAELTAENEKRATKLEGLRKAQAGGPGAQPLLDKKQLEALVKEYTRLRKMWAERKRLCMDAVGQVAEGAGKKPAQIVDMIGIETDEEARTALPDALT